MTTPRMQVFVTGGLGYVGGRCARFLAQAGLHVKIGSRQAAKIQPPPWLIHGSLETYSTSMSVAELQTKLTGVDVLLHLAAPNEIVSSQDPELCIEQNMVGTLRLCQAAKNTNIKHLIFFSTAHVYGSPLAGLYTEKSTPEAKHPYSYSHLAAEYVLRSFAGDGGIPRVTVLRLTNSFGAPERLNVDRWSLLVNDLCMQAVKFRSLTLKSTGKSRRDFVTLSDVERAVLFLMKQENMTGFEIYNLGSGKSMSVLEMASLVQQCAIDTLHEEISLNLPPSKDLAQEGDDLEISVAKLGSVGFKWNLNFKEEIVDTLKMCHGSIK